MDRHVLLPVGYASGQGCKATAVQSLHQLHLSDTVGRKAFSVHINTDLLGCFSVQRYIIHQFNPTQFIRQIVGIFFQFPVSAISTFNRHKGLTGCIKIIVYNDSQHTLRQLGLEAIQPMAYLGPHFIHIVHLIVQFHQHHAHSIGRRGCRFPTFHFLKCEQITFQRTSYLHFYFFGCGARINGYDHPLADGKFREFSLGHFLQT